MALNINGTTGISGVDGSVSALALTGTDSNTGITFPAADTIKFATGGVERMSITNSGVSGVGGKILQVVETTLTSPTSVQSQTFADIAGLSISITPSATSSKILLQYSIDAHSSAYTAIRLLRGSTPIHIGDAAGSRIQATINVTELGLYGHEPQAGFFLDSPNTTSATTYKFQGAGVFSASYIININKGATDTDYTYVSRGVSSIIAMEVAA